MKKGIQWIPLVIAMVAAGGSAHADYATTPVFSNITKTTVTITLNVGNDELSAAILNRQPIKIKYRKANDTKDTEVAFQYNIESTVPVPLTLTNLKPNQEYRIWIGQRATQICNTEALCAAIYTKYGTNSFTFKTKGDPVQPKLITKKLSYGDKSAEVAILKTYLASKGYMKASPTTTFDVPTLVGVLKFQMAKNLETDGVIGTSGRLLINQDLTTQAANGIVQ